jgi:NADH:ubiquinone reductase (H+-translocating)
MPEPPAKQRVVIIGAGFAGFNAARELRRLARATTEITVINCADYFLYLPLMPRVTSGLVEPRHALTPPQASSFDVISAKSVPLDVNQPRA